MAEAPKHRIGYADGLKFTTSLCLCYTLLVAGVRTWIRRTNYGVDDILITIATLICLGLFGSVYGTIHYGAGDPWKSIPASQIDSLNQASYASVATFVLALYTSKAAVIAFLARMSQQQHHLLTYWISMGFIAAAGLTSVLVVLVEWPLKSGYYFAFFSNQHSCDVQTTRWAVFTALDIFTEIILLILPAHLLYGLQMKTKEKAKVLTAFYLRVPVIGFSIGRLVYTQRLCNANTDAGKESAIVLIFLEIEASYAIVSSTFSTLKAFTSNFNSGFGFGFTQHAGAEDYAMSRVRRYGKGSATDSRSDPSPAPMKSQTISRDREITASPYNGEYGHNHTQIRASPLGSTQHDSQWQDNASDGSQDGHLETGIVRHTEYSVRHSSISDEKPILNTRSLPAGHALR